MMVVLMVVLTMGGCESGFAGNHKPAIFFVRCVSVSTPGLPFLHCEWMGGQRLQVTG
jgi:hypothetical protein